MGWLSGWFSGDDQDEASHAEALRYTISSRSAIRKWVNQFVPWEMVSDIFWDAVHKGRLESGRRPDVAGVLTTILEFRRNNHWQQGQLGWYRNDTLGLGKLSAMRHEQQTCLDFAAIVLTLDACGADNHGWESHSGPFQSSQAFVSPVSVAMYARAGRKLGYDETKLKREFCRVAQGLLLPLGAHRPDVEIDDLWSRVRLDLSREIKSRFLDMKGEPAAAPVLQPVS